MENNNFVLIYVDDLPPKTRTFLFEGYNVKFGPEHLRFVMFDIDDPFTLHCKYDVSETLKQRRLEMGIKSKLGNKKLCASEDAQEKSLLLLKEKYEMFKVVLDEKMESTLNQDPK